MPFSMKNNDTYYTNSNRGASLVLVTIFSTIVIGIVVTLTVISAMLLSNAGAEKRHDQAYEIATSLSARFEELILNGDNGSRSRINLDNYIPSGSGASEYTGCILDIPVDDGFFEGIPDASASVHVTAVHNSINEDVIDYYVLTVKATAAKETYIRTTEYTGNASSGYKRK